MSPVSFQAQVGRRLFVAVGPACAEQPDVSAKTVTTASLNQITVDGAQPFVSAPATPGQIRDPGNFDVFLTFPPTCYVFWSENLWIFSGFVWVSFCAGRELQRPKYDHVHPAFSCFFPFVMPQKVVKIQGFRKPFKTFPPWDHAQMIERKKLYR